MIACFPRPVLVALLVGALGSQLARADIYTWVDTSGTVNVSNIAPPEGTRVTIVTETLEVEPKPTLTGLLKFAGCMPGMPADFAEQHDHYIHGTPRR